MTPAARVQAAIEIVDLVIEAALSNGPPADRIVADWFRTHRFAGSKDRRAVRELTYRAIRVCGEIPESGRAAMLRLAQEDETIAPLFDGSSYGPEPIRPGEPVAAGGLAPAWLEAELARSGITGEEAAELLGRAPLDIRVNTLKASADALDLPNEALAAPAPDALRFPAGTSVEQWDAYKAGLIEVQDAGSQLACLAVGALQGEPVVDLCAGAGGKTLSLAAAMEDRGTLVACDTDRSRLSRLGPRAERAGVTIAATRLLDPGRELEALVDMTGGADAVLVDAPCSGTGTWRRKPETRWRLDEAQLSRHAELQDRLLDIGASLVRPGGRLVYVVCSLLDKEGKDRVDAYLERSPGWSAQETGIGAGTPHGAGIRLTPHRDETDGFFVARLARI